MKQTDDTGDILFHIENLEKRRDSREHGYRLLIRHLAARRGARLAITGPSGCGKSTTLDILGLALEPDAAETFSFRPRDAGINIRRLWKKRELDRMAALRLAHMGYVLQTGGLLPFLPVEDNMLLTARMSGRDEAEARERVRLLAGQLGIGKLLGAMPATLSVGERQRAAIVRALVPRPALILADEPTAALDPPHAARVMDLFLRAVEEQGVTLILVTHNADWAQSGGLAELRFDVREEDGLTTAILDDGAAPPPADEAEEDAETEAAPC